MQDGAVLLIFGLVLLFSRLVFASYFTDSRLYVPQSSRQGEPITIFRYQTANRRALRAIGNVATVVIGSLCFSYGIVLVIAAYLK